MAFWLPQTIQKRLLLHVLQQVSVFSNLDLSNLHVSLGSSSQFSFDDLNLVVDEISIPGLDIQSGSIGHLDLRLNVSGGVGVYGKGLELVAKPEYSRQDNESGSFSIAKSIQDLTNSIIQFTDTNQAGTLNAENDMASEPLNSPNTTSSSSSVSSREEIEAIPAVSALENVKNRILNIALSKLMITLEDINFKLSFEHGEVIELRLEKLCLHTGENNVRRITVHNLDVLKNKRTADIPNTSNMSSTMYYSQSEAASMYMSAMENPRKECSDNNEDQSGTVTNLISINSIDISFEGLASIEDLSLKDLFIDIDTVHVFADSLLGLNESVLDFLANIIFKEPVDKASQPSGLTGYKRFQKEQDILEGIAFLAIKANVIQVDFAQNFILLFRLVNLDSLGNKEYIITVDSFELQGEGFSSYHDQTPIFRGIVKNKESRFSILHDIDISLTVPVLNELFAFSLRIRDFVSLFETKISRRNVAKQKSSSEAPRVLTGTRCINIKLPLDNYELILKMEAGGSNTSSDIFKTNAIKLLRSTPNQTDVLLSLLGVSLTVTKSRVQLSAYDENLEDSLLTSKTFCMIKEIIIEDDFVKLQELFDDFRQLALIFNISNQKKNKDRKNSYLKRSVRILHSSNIIYKNTATASFALMIDSIKLGIKNFLKPEFGILEGTLSGITVAATQEGNLIAFAKQLAFNRLFADDQQAILKPIRLSNHKKPAVYFQRRSSGRIRITLRNMMLHYYAKWLEFFRDSTNRKSKESGGIEGPSSEALSWELKLIESSIFLLPHRLNAALVLVIDRIALNGKTLPLHIKSLLNSGTLLLVDDVCNIKCQDGREWPSLTSFYAHQGFSAIGKLDTISVVTQYTKGTISLNIRLHNLMLSLCADSAHTLAQLCIDLKIPVTFPDDQKYNYNNKDKVNVFEEVDPNFFNSSHIKQEDKSRGGNKDELIVVEDAFLERDRFQDAPDEGKYVRSIDELTNDSSSDFTSKTINFQEGYLDSDREEQRTNAQDEECDIDIKLEVEVGKVSLKLFDGYDWKYSRNFISLTIDQLDREIKAVEGEHHLDSRMQMSVFDSIYVTADTSDSVDLKKRVSEEIQGEKKSSLYSKKANLHPSRFYKALISLEKLKLSFCGYRVDNPTKVDSDGSADLLNKCDLSVQKFELVDNVPTSTWNKFMTLSRHEQWPRDKPMFSAQFSTVRPIDFLMATEMIINLEIAPLRLHVDQDALDFLVKFGEFKDKRFELIDDYPDTIFMQKFTTNSVKLKLDYKPKKVDYAGLRSGHTSELMNFFILEGAKLTLKGVVLYGVNGFPDMVSTLKAVWAPDIASKQLPGVLEGFAPVKSIAALGSGVKALVTVPLSEYRQDRRLGKSLKNGCNVFLKTTTGDFVKIGVKLASGTQAILENTEEIFGGVGVDGRLPRADEPVVDMESLLQEDQLVGGSNPKIKGQRPAALVIDPSKSEGGQPKIVSLYADQPLDLHKGLEEAYLSLEKHMHLVYDVVWKTKGELKDCQAGTAAAAVTAAKVAPVAIIRPLIGATEAVVRTLQGISNQFDKDQIWNFHDKYKSQNFSEQ